MSPENASSWHFLAGSLAARAPSHITHIHPRMGGLRRGRHISRTFPHAWAACATGVTYHAHLLSQNEELLPGAKQRSILQRRKWRVQGVGFRAPLNSNLKGQQWNSPHHRSRRAGLRRGSKFGHDFAHQRPFIPNTKCVKRGSEARTHRPFAGDAAAIMTC